MKNQHGPEYDDPRRALRPIGGRDELNLAEFPITLLSDRVPKGCKTLVFEVEPRDQRPGEPVTRKVTITGGDVYGLPTAVDDEVLVALIQLTKLKNDFSDPTVYFSRYEVRRLLGWPDDGRSYRRIEESIRRWVGVTLYYDNAWWNKETNAWVSENFHIIERSSLVDQETKRARRPEGQHELALSFFKWNEVIFQSFKAGSLKRLDIEAYFSYSTSIAKRVYRFLDKRFWIKRRWEFDLKEFAFEHIGLSRKYNVAQIKNKLQPALDELSQDTRERAAFLEPMNPEERYVKLSKGEWVIILSRKMLSPAALPDVPAPEPHGLVSELVNRGVTLEVAQELVDTSPAELVVLRLEVFDWLRERKNQKVIKESPTGYLIASIRDRYLSLPKGFESKAVREKRLADEEEKERQKAEAKRCQRAKDDREKEIHERVLEHWEALTSEGQRRLDAEAEANVDPAVLAAYRELAAQRNPMRDIYFKAHVRWPHIRGLLGLPKAEE